MAVIFLDNLVFHAEAVGWIHGTLFGHQIPDMAVGGQDLKVLAEIFFDGFSLGGRFNDNQVHGILLQYRLSGCGGVP